MIKLTNLQKVYQTEEVETTALNGINLHVSTGEFVSIMGPSGCGKSTLLNVMGLLDKPESGSYLFMETELLTLNEKARSVFRKQHMGFVFQNFNLIDELTVAENIELPLIYNKVPAGTRKKLVDEMLQRMNIVNRGGHFPQQLSGGQQQRVAVGRALITKPKLVLADEPTGNLDSTHGNEVMELLCELNDQGTTIVMVTHSSHDASFSNRIINLKDGHVISEKINKAQNEQLI
ncbi:ABC transporter ATP-binding protein [Pedobacter antarcticus]|uniref:Phosphonate ABC transporter ATP-binding protein n=2 Tax=Pedobacter antarcticus TaxID=34086 RepID=A0A081PIY4_9SPHI|nr:ABC transporter ATP-binding protein [Pedobacter antarcticus]KEQ30657.1 phosphonate ABC transporter ATP-binding protein [Pedobacter antarcticus 4BY]SDM28864.1 putative ABC transport system ATP-binding protein [Pedobacter antarcticus]SFF20003.1 putative ABC transport system ATP-binding protein [Pedobacter antarcticus]